MQGYFEAVANDLMVGSPVYFVVKDSIDYSDPVVQNKICGSSGCNSDSLNGQIYTASLSPEQLVSAAM